MSYCVNCGVKLEQSLKACPLCTCPVVNPMEGVESAARADRLTPNADGYGGSRPGRVHPPDLREYPVEQRVGRRRFVALLLTIGLAFAAGVCLLIEVIFNDTLRWSLTAAAGVGLLWVFVALPCFMRRPVAEAMFGLDMLACALFLWRLDAILYDVWFLPLGLPIVVSVYVLGAAMIAMGTRQIVTKLTLTGLVFLAIGLECLVIEAFLDSYLSESVHLEWSLFVVSSCALVAVMLTLFDRQERVKLALAKWFHI